MPCWYDADHVHRASESLNVPREYDQQRRTRCEAWCEERAGAASPAASLRAKGCVIVSPINREKQRGDVKRTGTKWAQANGARRSEHDRASASFPRTALDYYCMSGLRCEFREDRRIFKQERWITTQKQNNFIIILKKFVKQLNRTPRPGARLRLAFLFGS